MYYFNDPQCITKITMDTPEVGRHNDPLGMWVLADTNVLVVFHLDETFTFKFKFNFTLNFDFETMDSVLYVTTSGSGIATLPYMSIFLTDTTSRWG